MVIEPRTTWVVDTSDLYYRLYSIHILALQFMMLIQFIIFDRPRGLMDMASDFESEDCGFESHRGQYFFARIKINSSQLLSSLRLLLIKGIYAENYIALNFKGWSRIPLWQDTNGILNADYNHSLATAQSRFTVTSDLLLWTDAAQQLSPAGLVSI